MNKWDYTLYITDLWHKDWDNSNVHILGKEIAKRIVNLLPDYEDADRWGFELLEIVESLDSICTQEEATEINDDNFRHHFENNKMESYFEITPLEEFNNWWGEFYYFADRERIWVERG